MASQHGRNADPSLRGTSRKRPIHVIVDVPNLHRLGHRRIVICKLHERMRVRVIQAG